MDPYRADENPYFSSAPSSSSHGAASSSQQQQQQQQQRVPYPYPNPPLIAPLTPTNDVPSRAPRFPPPSGAQNVQFRSLANRQPSVIGIRRMRAPSQAPAPAPAQPHASQPLSSLPPQVNINKSLPPTPQEEEESPFEQHYRLQDGNRRRSSSEPQRPPWMTAQGRPLDRMASVPESPTNHGIPEIDPFPPGAQLEPQLTNTSRLRPSRSRAFLNGLSRRRRSVAQDYQQPEVAPVQEEYNPAIVDFLDVIDPEVATLSSITNIQNSLFVPSLGRFVNRRPTYDLSWSPQVPGAFPQSTEDLAEGPPTETGEPPQRPTRERQFSISSRLTNSHYAVLPSGVSLEGWTQEDVDQMNDHVRHMLHSRRSKFKRSLKAFGKYIRKPLGFLVTLYAVLITLFGLAWVLFLIGWIYVGNKQLYVINVIDNVLVALFAIVGDGMIPFRLVDTYHMIFIEHYHRLTMKRRKELALPNLQNKNDLPTDSGTSDPADLEAARERAATKSISEAEVSVLTPKQQAKLVHHQTKFAKSHTFYKPHETETHFAFSQRLLVAVVVLLDLHSCFQVALGTCTWSIDYHVRPAALTTTILCCSITVNAVAGILISIGDRRTRKKDVIERMFRQELTEEAMHKVQEDKAANEKREREGGGAGGSKERLWSKSLDLPRPSLGKWAAGGGGGGNNSKSDDSAIEKEPPRKEKGQVGKFDASTGVRDFQPA